MPARRGCSTILPLADRSLILELESVFRFYPFVGQ